MFEAAPIPENVCEASQNQEGRNDRQSQRRHLGIQDFFRDGLGRLLLCLIPELVVDLESWMSVLVR